MVDIKTQELTTFVFILPVAVCHSLPPPPPHTSPPSPLFPLCIAEWYCAYICTTAVSNWTIMPANPQGHLGIMHQRKGRGWNRGFVVKTCLSISLKLNLYNLKGGSSIFIEVFTLS